MDKATVLTGATGVSVELGSWYDWIDIGVSPEGKLLASIKPNDGERKDARISPKKVRKIAKALLALADEVDPPAPKVKYYQGNGYDPDEKSYYRISGATVQLFNKASGWTDSAWNGDGDSKSFRQGRKQITADELPKAAR